MSKDWALILGSSSGFGEATARELAAKGFNIAGVHFDRKSAMERVNKLVSELEDEGVTVKFFNENAAKEETRELVLDYVAEEIADGARLRVLMHSIAFGTLVRYIPDPDGEESEAISKKQIDMTLDVMANCLIYWTQDAVERDLLGEGSRILAMTSQGGRKAWPHYGAVSAAKAAIESHVRQLAVEMGPRGVTANCIQAGVTDTPALRKIPGHETMLEGAREANPSGRLTRPEDVASLIGLLTEPGSHFVSGNIIRCDGGEAITR